jgi:UDP:flavonoid glycosyltransferase YjiC (YdhE family)
VHEIGFVPLARLLPEVDAVIGAGGSGTVQATLAAGLPMVLRPVLADQPWTAQRVARAAIRSMPTPQAALGDLLARAGARAV